VPRAQAEVADCAGSGGFRRRAGLVVLEAFDEEGGVAYGGHHAEALDARFFGVGAAFDVDFMQGFDVLGDEGDGGRRASLLRPS